MAKLRQVLPALGPGSDEEWRAVPAEANGRRIRHLERLEMSRALEESPLTKLHRLRRELARITLEMDECLAQLERER